LFEFILAEKGLEEIFSSIGRLTEGMGMFDIPLSYSLLFKSIFFYLSGTKLFKSIWKEGVKKEEEVTRFPVSVEFPL